MPKTNPTDLFSEIAFTVEALGVDGTIAILKRARSESLTFTDKKVNFLCGLVQERFKTTAQDIIISKSKDGNRLNALKFICYYLKVSFKIPVKQIAIIISRDTSLVRRYCIEMNTIKTTKPNHGLQRHFQAFDIAITEFQVNSKKSK